MTSTFFPTEVARPGRPPAVRFVPAVRELIINTPNVAYWEVIDLPGSRRDLRTVLSSKTGSANPYKTDDGEPCPPDVMCPSLFDRSRLAITEALENKGATVAGTSSEYHGALTLVSTSYRHPLARKIGVVDTFMRMGETDICVRSILSIEGRPIRTLTGHRRGECVELSTGSLPAAIQLIAHGFSFVGVIQPVDGGPLAAHWESAKVVASGASGIELSPLALARGWIIDRRTEPAAEMSAHFMMPKHGDAAPFGQPLTHLLPSPALV